MEADLADLKVILKENARLVDELLRAGIKANEDVSSLPIIIKYGTFSPRRLESWDYEKIQQLALHDQSFQKTLGDALFALASRDLQPTVVTINEKKAVSFLLAGKERASGLLDALLKRAAATDTPRFFFLAREYLQSEEEWLRTDFPFALPFPEIRRFAPKFCEKYPLCAQFIVNPCAVAAEIAGDSSKAAEIGYLTSLAAVHFADKPGWIYDNILQPIWRAKNPAVAKAVLEALSGNDDFSEFCRDKLSNNSNNK